MKSEGEGLYSYKTLFFPVFAYGKDTNRGGMMGARGGIEGGRLFLSRK